MIITVLVSVSVGYFLGYLYAHHTNIHSILWELQRRGFLYSANFVDHDVFNDDLWKHKKSQKYFLFLRSAQKWAAKEVCRIKTTQYVGGNWVWIDYKGKTIAEFYC